MALIKDALKLAGLLSFITAVLWSRASIAIVQDQTKKLEHAAVQT
jgi:hypothetical protein